MTGVLHEPEVPPSPVPPPVVERELAGHNRITTQALSSVARAAAAQAFGVSPEDVRVSFSDDGGLLALALALPIGIPPLTAAGRDPNLIHAAGGTVLDRAVAAKGTIRSTVSRLTGSQLSRVDVRLTGSRPVHAGRVK